jgi:hypothetical protein
VLTFDPIVLEEDGMLLEFPGTVRSEWFESTMIRLRQRIFIESYPRTAVCGR